MPPPIEDAQAILASRAAELRAQLAAAPPAWASEVARVGATLEIGCGHGHFIAAYAQAQRAEPCLAVDVLAERLARAQRKLDAAALDNVLLLRSEARLLLDHLPDWLRLRRVFVLFPDPWPKRRHHKNRLLQAEFLTTLARRCVAGAQLFFRTDYAPYFAEVQVLLREHADWELETATAAAWPFEQESVFQKRAAGAYQSCVAVLAGLGREWSAGAGPKGLASEAAGP